MGKKTEPRDRTKDRGGLAALGDESTTSKPEKKAKKRKAASSSPAPKYSYAGRSEMIEKLVAVGKSDKEILEEVAAKFVGSTKSVIRKTIDAKRARAKKEEKAEKEAEAAEAKAA